MSTILFDLDGTLTDPREGITRSIAYALQSLAATGATLLVATSKELMEHGAQKLCERPSLLPASLAAPS